VTLEANLTNREETMKMRLLLTLAGLAVGIAVPVLAQEKDTVAPEVRQQIEAVFVKFQDAFNNRDAAGIGSLLTEDATELRSWQGWAIGQEAMVKRFESDLPEILARWSTRLFRCIRSVTRCA
jgi:hypothetical protein